MKTLTLLLLTFVMLGASPVKDKKLKWHPKRKISWQQFQGRVDSSSPYEAQIQTGFDYRYTQNWVDGRLNYDFDVFAYMIPRQSWSRKDKQTVALLNHERAHFAISEYQARLMYAEMVKRANGAQDTGQGSAIIKEVFTKYNHARNAMQEVYDAETDHSKNLEKQKEWEAKIAQWLEETPSY